MTGDGNEFLLNRDGVLQVNTERNAIFWLRMMNIFFTKAPLVMFESFEYACDYTHQTEHRINRDIAFIIVVLSLVLVLLCCKRFCEYKKHHAAIHKLVDKINTSINVLLQNSDSASSDIMTSLRLDYKHKELLTSLQQSEFVLLSSNLNIPPRTSRPNEHRICPTSSMCLEGIETLDLWLGIVWLGYCFLDKFHEENLSAVQISIIFTTALAYMLLHFKLPHSDLGAADCQILTKLSVFFDVHASYVMPNSNRCSRAGSMPQRPLEHIKLTRRNSF